MGEASLFLKSGFLVFASQQHNDLWISHLNHHGINGGGAMTEGTNYTNNLENRPHSNGLLLVHVKSKSPVVDGVV